ncbi:recQ-mediated genome instability protein 1-like [Centruroides sculpturatus]|uniref:recQ-mediated genome instability protein 1-like n=1 Tax=Centruroides sculpturatus TaxID=218467 RepID=UPI000C6DECD6|nr:recQ-mediated genome instability protein 1-like [Centruroides sculpturatus]
MSSNSYSTTFTVQCSYKPKQILTIQDISQSFYSQLIKLDGKENENTAVSATPMPTLNTWEIKPTRMLMLTLTDGVQILKGMEYKPIPFLHTKLPSGTKISVFGPIECRLGVLILSAEKIKILGGAVESLIEENNQRKILCGALGQDETSYVNELTRGENSEIQSNDSGIVITESNVLTEQNQNSNNRRALTQRTERQVNTVSSSNISTNYSNDNFVIDLTTDENEPESSKIVNVSEALEYDDDDEFMMSIDYDQLDQLVKENCNKEIFPFNEEIPESPPKKIRNNSYKIKAPPPFLSQIPELDSFDSDD